MTNAFSSMGYPHWLIVAGAVLKNLMPTVEQCRAYAAEHKILGANPRNSARRSTVLMNISRSWTALAHQLENLADIAKSEEG
jgi:hypothetical protein